VTRSELDGRSEGAADPIVALQRRLAEMAQAMRPWGPELRRLARALEPVVGGREAAVAAVNVGQGGLAADLYASTGSLILDCLARPIAEFERLARATEEGKTRSEDPDATFRIWREVDPEAPPAT
jgi:hypothetical protein